MSNIPHNPILNHPLNNQNLNEINMNQNENLNEIDMSEPSNNANQLSEEQKKEIAVENEIRDKLKCYICLSKVKKPKMCKFCKRLCCSDCINSWLSGHDYCGICKTKVTLDDLILVPFVDDMSTYFINNIENHPKYQLGKIDKNKINNTNKTQIMSSKKNKKDIINDRYEQEEDKEDKNICKIHGNKIDYYCVQCDKYFCSNCLVFFGQEVKKHTNHLILQVSQMNDLGIMEAVNEYKKLPETKNTIDHLIGLCNLKLKENHIKRCEFEDNMNTVKNLFIKKLDESTKDLQIILNNLKNQKDRIDGSIGSIPNGFNNIVNSNDHAQGNVMTQELKKLNKIDKYLESDIKEKSKMKPKLFIENYESNFLEIKIPYGGQYNEGAEIYNQKLNIIPNNQCKLNLTYLQNQVYISLSIDINLPLNSPEYPKFYSYIIIRNQKYGLEFINLSNQTFPQDIIRGNSGKTLGQQINNITFDFQQFIYLSGEEKIIKIKIFITKVYFKE
jgi:hypothetical protein